MMKFVVKDQDNPAEFSLKNGVNLVGRDESCDIVINSTHVSRNHISCVVSRDRVVIQDLNSRNGTFVNGLRVKNSVEIKVGDVISLGKYTMVFEDDRVEGEAVMPSVVVSDEEETDESHRGDTLPLKGEMARRGEGDEQLPAKYDPSRYAVTTRDNKIVLSNGMTGDALEIYRGGPDALTLDHLIAERRARQRRNMILAIAGGVFVLALVLALVVMLKTPEPVRPRRKIDREKYYLSLNEAVKLYTTDKKIEAGKKLDEAKKIAGNSQTYNLHVQLRNLFNTCDQLDKDWQNLNTTEANRIFNYVIDLDDLPENFDIQMLREWLTEKKLELRDFAADKVGWEIGEAVSRQIQDGQNIKNKDALAALKGLRKIRAGRAYGNKEWKKYYTKEAWKAEKAVSLWLVEDILGEDPNNLETDIGDITVERARDMVEKVSEVLAKSGNIVSDEKIRGDLIKYRDNCFDVLKISREKKEAYEAALVLYEEGRYLEAKEVLKNFSGETEDEVIKNLIRNIDLALVVFSAYEDAKKRYNAGRGEEALDILNARIDDAYNISSGLHNKYDRLRRNIEDVCDLYGKAMEAEKISDVLRVQEICNEIAQRVEKEEGESNHYYDWALREASDIKRRRESPRELRSIIDAYVSQAEKFLKEDDYSNARNFASKANVLDTERNPGKMIFYEISRRGSNLLKKASALHKEGRDAEAVEILERILEEKIYKDGDGVADAAHTRLREWGGDK